MMKKTLSIVLCFLLLGSLTCTSASAETDLSTYAIANGTVQAADYDEITAPCSGTLLPFDWEAGNTVDSGIELFALMTEEICAPEDGTVGYLFAEEGDNADAVMAAYGAVVALQPEINQRMHCTYSGAADYEENKHLHIGDKVFFKADKEKGTGTVIAVSGNDYEVEITAGSFEKDESVSLYKDAARASHDKVGTGKVYYRDDVLVGATGRIAEVCVAEGDNVKQGDVLLKVLAPDAPAGVSPSVIAPKNGVIGEVVVVPGQQVWKGQKLCRILRNDTMEVVAEVDEMDMQNLRVGDELPVTLDVDEGRILLGTVTEISSLGVTRQNAAYFKVHVSVASNGLKLGQSASVYLPKI